MNGDPRQTPIPTVICSLLLLEAVSLLVAAIVHVGVEIPIGIMVLAEPQIIPATIVEGLCGLFLAGSAYGVFVRKSWAWRVAVAAQAVALGGVFLGIGALAAGAGPNTASNALYHRVMLVVLAGGLLLLWIPAAKTALGRNNQASQHN